MAIYAMAFLYVIMILKAKAKASHHREQGEK
jgi:hypothetical protein